MQVLISSSSFSSSDCNAITAASVVQLSGKAAKVLGLSLAISTTNQNSSQSLLCAVGAANAGSVYSATLGASLAGTTAEMQLNYAISLRTKFSFFLIYERSIKVCNQISGYQQFINSLTYSIPEPLSTKTVDLVFLIDQSFYTFSAFNDVCLLCALL